MNLIKRSLLSVALASTLTLATPTLTQAAGLLTPMGQSSSLAIAAHQVSVQVDGHYAVTTVDQTFSNHGSQDTEATYSFPIPEHGTVAGFTVWIDGQPVEAEVLEKEQARRVYEEEKAQGREAGLAEKNGVYDFRIQVSPVRAGQDVKLQLTYMQPIKTDNGIGRYVYPLADGGTDDQAVSFFTRNERVEGLFSFDMQLRPGISLDGVMLPKHPRATISSNNAMDWQVSLGNAHTPEEGSANTPTSLDQDIVTYWRLSPSVPASVDLMTYKAEGETTGTFMLTLAPGDDLQPISAGQDWIFVLDQSGSMDGKYAMLIDGVSKALGQLRSDDRFRVIGFNNNARELTHGWVNADPQSVAFWSDTIAKSGTDGGTNLYAGLDKAIRALDADRTTGIILVTDGVANVGQTERREFLDLMKQYDVRLFTAIMGNGADRPLLEAMTEVSNGTAISVSNSDDIAAKVLEMTNKVTHQAFHDVELKIDGVKAYDLAPAVTTTLYRGEPLTVFGHYDRGGEATITFSGKISGEEKTYSTTLTLPDADERHPELERLWALSKIDTLEAQEAYIGNSGEYTSQITDLAIRYGLVTDRTSMVVMREEQFENRGIERHNRDRRAKETAAQQTRAAQAPVSYQADAAQPMFHSPRPSYSGNSNGGGAGNPLLWLALPLLWIIRRQRG